MRCQLLIFFALTFLISPAAQAARFAYLPNQQKNNLTIVDLEKKSVILELPVGLKPYGIAISPNGERVYIANSQSGTISVLDTSDNKIIAEISVGNTPRGIAVSSDGRRVYVAISGDHRLAVIDTEKNQLINLLPTQGIFPWGLALNPQNQRLYVSNYGSDNKTGEISVFDLSIDPPLFKGKLNLSSRVGGHSRPRGIEVSGDRIYVTVFDHAVNKNYRLLLLKEDFSDSSQLKPMEIEETGEDPINLTISGDKKKVYIISSDQNIFVHDSFSLELLNVLHVGKPIGGITVFDSNDFYILIPNVLLKLVDSEGIYPDIFSSIYLREENYQVFGKFIGPELKPQIIMNPNPLIFPTQPAVTLSRVQKIKLTIKNTSVILDNFYLEGEEFKFSLSSTNCQVGKEMNPGESCEIGLTFQPLSQGEKNSFLTIRSRSGEEWRVSISGNATVPISSSGPLPKKPIPSTVEDENLTDFPLEKAGGCNLSQSFSSPNSFIFILIFLISLFLLMRELKVKNLRLDKLK